MRIHGVLLPTVAEQIEGGDHHPLDPTKVKLVEEGEEIPVEVAFNRADKVGHVVRTWLEDGRLMFEAEVAEPTGTKLPPYAYAGHIDLDVKVIGLDAGKVPNHPAWERVDG